MRILIHGVAMRKEGGGWHHLKGIIDAVGKLDIGNEYLLCLDRRFKFNSPYANVHVIPVTIHSLLNRLWWDQVSMPLFIRKQKVGLILAMFVFGSYKPPVPQIIFQTNSLFFCKDYLDNLPKFSRWGLELRLRRKMAYWSMLGSNTIVVPSNSMKQMILEYCPQVPAEQFQVIPHGFDKEHFQASQPLKSDLQAKLEGTSNAKRILYVSHLEPHKDVQTAIQAMHLLKGAGENVQLFLTLDSRDDPTAFESLMKETEQLGLNDVIVNFGRVPENQIYQLYRQADIFLFPSLCESFGFPMKEALSVGLPIVASDTLINREICGNAALYFTPRDSKDATRQISRLLHDQILAKDLRSKSKCCFDATTETWDSYTRSIVTVINSVIKDGHFNV